MINIYMSHDIYYLVKKQTELDVNVGLVTNNIRVDDDDKDDKCMSEMRVKMCKLETFCWEKAYLA